MTTPDESTPFQEMPEDAYPTQDHTGATLNRIPKKDRKGLWLALTILGLLALLACAYFGYSKLVPQENLTPAPIPQVAQTAPTKNSDPAANKPLLQQYKAAPEVKVGHLTVNSIKTGFIVSDGAALALRGFSTTPAEEQCAVHDPTDFCLAGIARNSTGSLYNVYYLKDAVHSRLFEAPTSFSKAAVTGSPSAGILPVNMGNSATPVLVIVNRNSSGWMLVPADAKSKVQGVAAQASVK